jgi:SAM-dependent methyltransferase
MCRWLGSLGPDSFAIMVETTPPELARNLARHRAAMPEEILPNAAPGVLETILSMLPSPCRTLNAGAGRGGLSWLLHRAGFDVTSADLHPEHFRVQELSCQRADFLKPLPFPDDQYDLVVTSEVLEHLENPWAFLRECVRVLRRGGHLVASSPNVQSWPSRLAFLFSGLLPYFREESFVGCYHVTPIFSWSVQRFCRTTDALVEAVRYSRVEWPTRHDVPRHWSGRVRGMLLRLLPRDARFGEVAIYHLRKAIEPGPRVDVGRHSA